MRSRTAFVSVAVVVLAFAGCGSTKKAATTAATKSPIPSAKPPPAISTTYNANLSGAVSGPYPAPAGAPNGSGLAVITINASTGELCWKFSQLKNVTAPTAARIFRWAGRASWMYGVPLGGAYRSSGCVREGLGILGRLEAHSQEWYVSIHNAQFPGGAVRGQL